MKIYVSNLSFNTGDTELNDLFTPFGTVESAKVVTDRESGRSRGFGFVEMPSEDDGNDAIKKLNGKEIEGRAVSVSIAREKAERSNGFSSGGNKRSFGGGGYGNRRY
ncbi:MAG: RNA-binding protein [Bacteroidetes bacterium]|nr:RNA-binding protein [Bacteroidota bacterium]